MVFPVLVYSGRGTVPATLHMWTTTSRKRSIHQCTHINCTLLHAVIWTHMQCMIDALHYANSQHMHVSAQSNRKLYCGATEAVQRGEYFLSVVDTKTCQPALKTRQHNFNKVYGDEKVSGRNCRSSFDRPQVTIVRIMSECRTLNRAMLKWLHIEPFCDCKQFDLPDYQCIRLPIFFCLHIVSPLPLVCNCSQGDDCVSTASGAKCEFPKLWRFTILTPPHACLDLSMTHSVA